MLQPAATADPSPQDGRSTSFQAVDGNVGEQRNGATLMIEAYALIWLILMGWLLLMWSRQRGIQQRLDGLEAAIARAEAKASKPG